MKSKTRLFVFVSLILTLLTGSMCAQEQTAWKKDIPKAVLDAFKKSYPNASIQGYSKETENNTVLYEVESTEGTIHRDITYKSDGSLVTIEESFPFEELPEAVRNTIEKKYPKAKIEICEKVTEGSVSRFELLLTWEKKKLEVVLNPDGTVVKTEEKQGKEIDEG